MWGKPYRPTAFPECFKYAENKIEVHLYFSVLSFSYYLFGGFEPAEYIFKLR